MTVNDLNWSEQLRIIMWNRDGMEEITMMNFFIKLIARIQQIKPVLSHHLMHFTQFEKHAARQCFFCAA